MMFDSMRTRALSRRSVLEVGVCVLTLATAIPTTVTARADANLSPRNEDAVRRYYAAWDNKDWRRLDLLLAEDFTFTSANNDDHIGKGAFKARCWDSQVKFIERFDIQQVIGSGNSAFVLYVAHTSNGKTFRNVEYLQLRDGQVVAIECYFGAPASFASSASTGQP